MVKERERARHERSLDVLDRNSSTSPKRSCQCTLGGQDARGNGRHLESEPSGPTLVAAVYFHQARDSLYAGIGPGRTRSDIDLGPTIGLWLASDSAQAQAADALSEIVRRGYGCTAVWKAHVA